MSSPPFLASRRTTTASPSPYLIRRPHPAADAAFQGPGHTFDVQAPFTPAPAAKKTPEKPRKEEKQELEESRIYQPQDPRSNVYGPGDERIMRGLVRAGKATGQAAGRVAVKAASYVGKKTAEAATSLAKKIKKPIMERFSEKAAYKAKEHRIKERMKKIEKEKKLAALQIKLHQEEKELQKIVGVAENPPYQPPEMFQGMAIKQQRQRTVPYSEAQMARVYERSMAAGAQLQERMKEIERKRNLAEIRRLKSERNRRDPFVRK